MELKRLGNADSNRLANRQRHTRRFAPKPFRFSEKCNSNRLLFWAIEIVAQRTAQNRGYATFVTTPLFQFTNFSA